jgi:hypothetical protein
MVSVSRAVLNREKASRIWEISAVGFLRILGPLAA